MSTYTSVRVSQINTKRFSITATWQKFNGAKMWHVNKRLLTRFRLLTDTQTTEKQQVLN